jgi:hypothetical protein
MTSTYSRTVEVTFDPQTGDQIITRSKSIREYLHVKPSKGVFIVGQETRQVSQVAPYQFILELHDGISDSKRNPAVLLSSPSA